MLVLVLFRRWVRRRRATLAIDPARFAIDVVFFLPDRHAVFDRVDDVAAGGKRLGAVCRARADPDREVADGEIADAVHTRRALDAEAFDGFGYDARAFRFCQ